MRESRMTPELTQEQILLEVRKLRRERDLYAATLKLYEGTSAQGKSESLSRYSAAAEALAEGIRIREEEK